LTSLWLALAVCTAKGMPGALQRLIPLVHQGLVFGPANLVNRFVEVLGNVEPVMHDFRIRNMRIHAVLVRLPHVHDPLHVHPVQLQMESGLLDAAGRLQEANGEGASNMSVNRPCGSAQGTSMVFTPQSGHPVRGMRAVRMVSNCIVSRCRQEHWGA